MVDSEVPAFRLRQTSKPEIQRGQMHPSLVGDTLSRHSVQVLDLHELSRKIGGLARRRKLRILISSQVPCKKSRRVTRPKSRAAGRTRPQHQAEPDIECANQVELARGYGSLQAIIKVQCITIAKFVAGSHPLRPAPSSADRGFEGKLL